MTLFTICLLSFILLPLIAANKDGAKDKVKDNDVSSGDNEVISVEIKKEIIKYSIIYLVRYI